VILVKLLAGEEKRREKRERKRERKEEAREESRLKITQRRRVR
jgi:hypothetical protein